MSEFTDLLLQIFSPAEALLFLGLVGVDYIQVRAFRRELRTFASLGTEEQRAIADGGTQIKVTEERENE